MAFPLRQAFGLDRQDELRLGRLYKTFMPLHHAASCSLIVCGITWNSRRLNPPGAETCALDPAFFVGVSQTWLHS